MCYHEGFSGGSDSKESACGVRDQGSIPGSGRSPGEGNGDPLQYSCLENPMGGGVWQATVHGVAKSDTLHVLLSQFGTSLLFHVQFYLLLLDQHTDFSGGRYGGLVSPSLEKLSTFFL